ncbi:MAG: YdcF family protein [Oscillospiraceae bacterium]|nr:YdcF family protein [Oscillospiraceae bacterium]
MKRYIVNTRDKKPKLYNLLILTAAVAVVIGLLLLFRPPHATPIICILAAAFCLAAAVILLYSWREQIRYNPYSYNTIIYFGFALYALYVMGAYIALANRVIRYPDVYGGSEIIRSLLGSARNYMYYSFPFILIFSVALCVSNISLIVHEGKRLVNFLGILLAFLLVGGIVCLFIYDFSASGSMTEVMIHDLITYTAAAVYLYFECMLIGTIVAGAFAAKYEPEKNVDFLIVLGCGLKKDGTLTPLLQGRADRAIGFYERQKDETGKELTFITSGGQGADEIVSESRAMKRYLTERGIPAERILEEDRSVNTFENMRFSKELIQKIDPNGKVAFSTTNYHVFRSGIFARRVKMRAVGMGAETKWYFWPNAAVREFAGLLSKHRVKQSLILGGMVTVNIVLTLLSYLIFV